MTDPRLGDALLVAIRAHAGQLDKSGEPYLLHVIRVVKAVPVSAQVIAALHDVAEDSAVPVTSVRLQPFELDTLALLTRGGLTYDDYIKRMVGRGHPRALARTVKVADLRDNLYRIPPGR